MVNKVHYAYQVRFLTLQQLEFKTLKNSVFWPFS